MERLDASAETAMRTQYKNFFLKERRLMFLVPNKNSTLRSFEVSHPVRATALVVAVDLLLSIKEKIFSCFWLIANTIKRAVATEPNPIESLNFLCGRLYSSSFNRSDQDTLLVRPSQLPWHAN